MNFKYIILGLFILPILVLGQGFKGKTLSITPHLSGIYTGPDDYLDINALAANLDIEKAFNRSFSIGITGFRLLTTEEIWAFNPGERVFRGSGLGVFFRRYFLASGSIAPLGPFAEIGFARNSYNINDENGAFVDNIKTFAATTSFGLNWFLGKNVLIFAAIEGKYEIIQENVEVNRFLMNGFRSKILETLPVNVKLGITIPLI
ncbi:MAG: hypothetical protein AB8H47_31180 [Bacteroidia bacterium]